MIGTFWKKRIDSNRTEKTMPAVVAIEMPAASHRTTVTQRSTVLRARKSRWTWRSAAERQNSGQGDAGDQQGDPAEGQQRAVVVGGRLHGRRDLAGRRQPVARCAARRS